MRRAIPFTAVVVATMFGSTGLAAAESPPPNSSAPDALGSGAATGGAIPDQFIVRFVPSTNVLAKTASIESADLTVRTVYSNVFPGAVVRASPSEIAALRADPQVSSVEPDSVVRASGVQQEVPGEVKTQVVQSSAPWGLDRIDQRNRPLSGTYNHAYAGSGVNAYVIDTGMRLDHSDFTGRVGWGAGPGGDVNDCNGHGTHVAGTIGGSTYGVAKRVTLVPVKVLGCDGSGYVSDVIAGLDWVIADHSFGTPAVANMSLGFNGPQSSVDVATQSLIDDGVAVVVAAGNSGTLACDTSPARVTNAITVAATDISDARASFSNYGSCVDIFAPGVGISSAWYTSSTATNSISGTSMASPHVAGAAAVALTQQPSLSPGQVASRLASDATPNLVTSPGFGTPNRLLYADTTAPVSVLSKPSSRWTLSSTVPVAWSATDSGTGVATYDVARRSGAWNAQIAPASSTWLSATTASSQTFPGTAGSTYCLKSRARDYAANVSSYTGERCTAVPLRSDQVTKTGTWTRHSLSTAYAGFYYRTTALGAKVTRTGLVAKRIALVVTVCSTCGSMKVYWNGVYQKTVALTSSTTLRKQTRELLTFPSPATGTLTLVVSTSGKAVLIEGLAVSKSGG